MHRAPTFCTFVKNFFFRKQKDLKKLWATLIVVHTETLKRLTFALRREPVHCLSKHKEIPRSENVKYLDLHLDQRLTWKAHRYNTKRKQLDMRFKKVYWLLGCKSQLSLNNRVLNLYGPIV